jgi:hypothetical protein
MPSANWQPDLNNSSWEIASRGAEEVIGAQCADFLLRAYGGNVVLPEYAQQQGVDQAKGLIQWSFENDPPHRTRREWDRWQGYVNITGEYVNGAPVMEVAPDTGAIYDRVVTAHMVADRVQYGIMELTKAATTLQTLPGLRTVMGVVIEFGAS